MIELSFESKWQYKNKHISYGNGIDKCQRMRETEKRSILSKISYDREDHFKTV